MLHRINKALPTAWVTPTTIQIGLGANQLRLENLTEAEQRIVASLYSGIVQGQENVLDSTIGANPGDTLKLVERLGPLVRTEQRPAFGPWQEVAFAEIARAALDYNVNGEMVLAERWQRSIHIDQLDKTGLMLTKALLASGIGKVVSHDSGKVLRTDLGELGYPPKALGMDRHLVATSILEELALPNSSNRIIDLNLRSNSEIKLSFAITVGHLALNPRTYSRWLARDVDHIGITFNLDFAQISPVVIPGKTACLNCLQELAVDKDEYWPVIATQLLELPRMRDDAAALLAACGLACRAILRRIDEQSGFKQITATQEQCLLGYRIDYATGNVERVKYERHSLCSCQEFSQKTLEIG